MGYIFFAMAVGMAVGTKFYIVGSVPTFMFAMAKCDLGAKPLAEVLLKVMVGKHPGYQKDRRNIF